MNTSGQEAKMARNGVAVLPLERINASKKFVGRPKDLAHLPLLEQPMKLRCRIACRSRKAT